MTFNYQISVESTWCYHLFSEAFLKNLKCKKGNGGDYSETSFENDYIISRKYLDP